MKRDFTDAVFDVVRLIPFGRVTSYGAIAKHIGSAQSSRMVGWILNKSLNEKDKVPAHRVVNRSGLLTGKNSFGEPNKMQTLLENEGVIIVNDRIVNFKTVFWNPSTELNDSF